MMVKQKKGRAKARKTARGMARSCSLQQELDGGAQCEGFTVGPVWHGSPDFVGDAFSMKYRGRLSGISRGGINFTKNKARAEAYRDAVFSDSEQTVIDDAVQMVNDAIEGTTFAEKELDRFQSETGYEWETFQFSGRNVDDWDDFRLHLKELSVRLRQIGKGELADVMRRAAELGERKQRPRLVRAFLKSPRLEIQNGTGDVVYVVDDPSQIKEVPEVHSSSYTNTAEFKKWFCGSKVIDKLGNPLIVFHGATKREIHKFDCPAFFTDNREGAEFYLNGESDGVMLEAYLSLQNPFYACHSRMESMAFIDIARRAGVEVTVTEGEYGWSFEAPDIARYSPYDGENLNDLIYVPAVREQLWKEGYDSLVTSDVIENGEIETYVALSAEQVRIVVP